jgi:hypothetical protein
MFKLGRNRPSLEAPRLILADYLISPLPTEPAWIDYTPAAQLALDQMYLNDALGCCVISGMQHADDIVIGNAGGPPTIFTNVQTTATYSAVGGYVPGQPATDQGCDEITGLNYWRDTGLANGSKIAGHVTISPAYARQALWLFEILVFGIELPDAWLNPPPERSQFTWDVAGDPNPDNGHCVVGGAYNSKGIIVSTWGMLGTMTYAAIEKYCVNAAGGELHCAISHEALIRASAKAPNNFDWPTLVTDFRAMGGTDIPALT